MRSNSPLLICDYKNVQWLYPRAPSKGVGKGKGKEKGGDGDGAGGSVASWFLGGWTPLHKIKVYECVEKPDKPIILVTCRHRKNQRFEWR